MSPSRDGLFRGKWEYFFIIIFIAINLCGINWQVLQLRGDRVRTDVRKALATLYLTSFLVLGVASCGGGSTVSGGGPGGSGGGPGGGSGGGASAGEYLWEFSLTDDGLFLSTVNSSTGQLGAPTDSGGVACNSLGTIPSIAVAPSNTFAFVIDKCLTSIHSYSISGPGVALAEISQSPFFLPGTLDSIAIDPSGKFLYAVGTVPGAIYQLDINASTGELTLLSTTMETADLRAVVADPNGNFIFVNDLTGGHIFAYLVGGGSSLASVPGSPFTVPSNGQPVDLVMASGGKFLYAPLFSGGIAGFSVNSSTGALSVVPGSPFPTSNQPFALAVDSSGGFLYSIGGSSNNTIEGFSMDANTGALTAIMGSPFNAPSPLSSLAVDPSGKFLYATVQTATLPDSVIFGFAIDPSDGSLSALATSPYPAPPFPVDVVSLNIP
jgi:6-phosphogluconolactonase